MTLHRSARLSVATVVGAVLLGSLLTGCVQTEPETAPEPDPSTSASASAAPESEAPEEEEPSGGGPSVLQIPQVTDKEIARAVLTREGGATTSTTTIVDAVIAEEPLILEGACVGENARYQIVDAAVDGDGDVLETGVLVCNEALYVEFDLDVDGPVQVSFTGANDIDEGWLLVTRVNDVE